MKPSIERWLGLITRRPGWVLAVFVLLSAFSMLAITRNLGVNSDPIAMLDEDLPFRQIDARLKHEFPTLDDSLLIVLDAPTPEQAWLVAREVRQRLDRMPELIVDLSWPAGSEFFSRNGLLFLDIEALQNLADRLGDGQALLGRLARETSAAALFELLALIQQQRDQLPPDFDIDALQAQIAAVMDEVIGRAAEASSAGQDPMLSWQALLGGQAERGREILLVNPVLDHSRVLAAREVMAALIDLRAEMGLDQGPVRMRLTGSSALRHEEMQSVIDGAALTGTLALVMVTAVMLLGLRSLALSLIALVNLGFGLILTTGFAALAIGRVNLISVSFVVLYIGLGVNYAVHYLLRYREIVQQEPHTPTGRLRAIIATGRFLRRALLLSALTTALGFFAFVPTAFSGIAQLGLIAGVAMGITLLLSYTTLPAMLALFRPALGDRPPLPGQGWRRALNWPLDWRVTVLAFGALALLLTLPALPRVGFDSDPLNVRDPTAESVVTIRELLQQGEAGFRNIQVLVPAGEDPEPLRQALQALPAVERAVSLASFVPDDQDDKLAVLEELSWLLGPDIPAADWRPLAITPEGLADAARRLADAIDDPDAPLRHELLRLDQALDGPAAGPLSERINRALVGGLEPSLGRLTPGLREAARITAADLPDWLVRQWRGTGGDGLIQVFPVIDAGSQDSGSPFIKQFVDQVLSVAEGRATGGPVVQQAAAKAITEAFRQAMVWAAAGIALVLVLMLRSIRDTLFVLAPLLLGGLLTLAVMVMLDLQFNFANVVALPLLLGVAVDNGIHLVQRHRAGLLPDGNVLATASARAIVVGALITAAGFGNLVFSPHAGTASLGAILAIGLALMVIATLVFLPAMLGRRLEPDPVVQSTLPQASNRS